MPTKAQGLWIDNEMNKEGDNDTRPDHLVIELQFF